MIIFLLFVVQLQDCIAIPNSDARYENFLDLENIIFSYDERTNSILTESNGITVAAFPYHIQKSIPVRDTIATIWLPDSAGGVTYPWKFVKNPYNDAVYVIGQYSRNIAVCNAETGQRIASVFTGDGTVDLAFDSTDNKLYCANYYDGSIDVIDCATNTVNTSLRLQSLILDIDWNKTNNCIYCGLYESGRVDVFDCTVDSIMAQIPVGAYPSAILFNPLSNKVYCTINGAVAIIDCGSNSVVTTIPISQGNYRLALNTVNNKIYCADVYNNNVSVIDGAGDTLITTITVGSWPECIAYNMVLNRVYVGHISAQNIYVIDGNTNQVITTISTGSSVYALTYDSLDNRLFAALSSYQAAVINCSNNSIVGYLAAANWPMGIFWESDYNQVWIGNTGASNLPGYTIDAYSGNGLGFCFKSIIGYTPYSTNLDTAVNKYQAAGRGDRFMATMDLANTSISSMKALDNGPWDVVDNQTVGKTYCANRYSSNVTVMDAVTESTLAAVNTGQYPVGLAFNATDNKVYAVNFWGNNVTVIDGNTNGFLYNLTAGSGPYDIMWNPSDNKIYTADYGNNTVTIIDAHADTVISRPAVGQWPWSLVHNSVNDKIYIANYASDDITVIDGITNNVTSTITLPADAYPFTLAYNPQDNKVYSANIFSNSFTIIDAETDSIVVTMGLAGAPFALLYNPMHNTVFCAYINAWQEAIMVIDGASNTILADILLPTHITNYGLDSPKNAFVLDPVMDIVYFSHYCASRITAIEGATGVGISDFTSQKQPFGILSILPNPVTDHAVIEYDLRKFENGALFIYDASGRIVSRSPLPPTGKAVWNLNDESGKKVPAGVYFVQLKSKGYQATKKLVVQK